LTGSRLKLARAKEHLDELHAEITAYVKRKPHPLSDEDEIEGEWIVHRFAEVREPPDPRWGVRAGEFFHDLRSALDNLVWQLVLVNGEEPGEHNQFPIYTDPTRPPGAARLKQLKGVSGATRLDDMLLGVHPDHAATIKVLQTYDRPEVNRLLKVALHAVADRNNIDKHRFVHPTLAFSDEGKGSTLTHTAGPPPTRVDIEYMVGAVYEGAEAFRWRVVGGTRRPK